MRDNLLQKQAEQVRRDGAGRFLKGSSGNPAGRPPGLRNAAALFAERLLDGEAEALTRKAVELALAGDGRALRLCLERLLAPRRERPVPIILPPLRDPADLAAIMAAVAAALARGELSAGEAGDLARVVETFMRAIEASDFERRLQALEADHEPGA
jgi:hypothetical protein